MSKPYTKARFRELCAQIVREQSAKNISNLDLKFVASVAQAPFLASNGLDWAERFAVPVLHELARRFSVALPPTEEIFDGQIEEQEAQIQETGPGETPV